MFLLIAGTPRKAWDYLVFVHSRGISSWCIIPRASCSGTRPINVTRALVNVRERLVLNSESCTYQAKQRPLEQMPSRSISLWIPHGPQI